MPHTFLDCFQQVVRFQLLNHHVGVTGHAEWVCLQDLHARKQGLQVGNNHLVQPDKGILLRAGIVFDFGFSRFESDQLRQRAGNLDPCKMLFS